MFYYLTDPESARRIADVGFAESGIWSPYSTVTLIDQVPGDTGGGILRIGLAPADAAETMRREASDPGEGYRKFLVPMNLLKYADVALVADPDGGFTRDRKKPAPSP